MLGFVLVVSTLLTDLSSVDDVTEGPLPPAAELAHELLVSSRANDIVNVKVITYYHLHFRSVGT
jgi:hypothetical protein